MDLASELNRRIEVYSKQLATDLLGQEKYQYSLLKKVFAKVVPLNGSYKEIENNAETSTSTYTTKFIIRTKSIPSLSNTMYFVYENQKYEIGYFIPNYKFQDTVEVFTTLIVE